MTTNREVNEAHTVVKIRELAEYYPKVAEALCKAPTPELLADLLDCALDYGMVLNKQFLYPVHMQDLGLMLVYKAH